ncbi:MAG: Holliday junction branch migration protein RuvA [Candidatus Marinimicrobia bacterium]|nr:Holliday junction branch migration protein RuvA [Candidatus Neomarinimicrobiota bacterium]
MIDSIFGKLVKKSPTAAIVDVGGIRFELNISVPAYDRLPKTGAEIDLLTYLHVREDILKLYAFVEEDERKLFLLLIAITGIGPRSAMTILSGTNPKDFKNRIIAGDVKSLTNVPGIGPKTAKRIIIELKEKFVNFEDDENLDYLSEVQSPYFNDAILALMSLGYKRHQCQRALKELEKDGQLAGGLEMVLKKALAKM